MPENDVTDADRSLDFGARQKCSGKKQSACQRRVHGMNTRLLATRDQRVKPFGAHCVARNK